jgi:hypothetical protein
MALVCTSFIPSISTMGTCWNIKTPSFGRRTKRENDMFVVSTLSG